MGFLNVSHDESVGVPPGGSAGQVLTKKTSADYDAEWTAPETGSIGGDNDITKNDCRVIKDVAFYYLNTTKRGILKITIPNKLTADTMMRGEIVGQDYTNKMPWKAEFAAMGDSGDWSYLNGILYPGCPFSTIRTGYDGTNLCIVLGTTSTSWPYPSITIPRVQVSFKGIASVPAEWTMDILTSASGITFSGTNTISTISYTQSYTQQTIQIAETKASQES